MNYRWVGHVTRGGTLGLLYWNRLYQYAFGLALKGVLNKVIGIMEDSGALCVVLADGLTMLSSLGTCFVVLIVWLWI